MRAGALNLLAGSGLVLLASAASAQTQPAAGATAAGAEASFGLEEIIVTARRKAESLQDVPQTVDAVTADEIERLSLQQFTDVQAIVPGLTLTGGSNGYTTAATIRGASFQVESSATPTVEFYLNDGPIQSVFLFQSMYDLGQIEVLRGPQGTLRGRAAPSGSITVTTRDPELSEFGGYVNTLATDEDSMMAQGAVNIPLIADTLAIRVAGVYEDTEYDHVKSINNSEDPSQETRSGRVSLRWEPNDAVSAKLMYQYLERDLLSFDGYESFALNQPGVPAVEPILRAEDRLGITDGGRDSTQKFDILTGQIDWRFGGQKLSYVGTYTTFDNVALTPQDTANAVPNFEFYQDLHAESEQRTHELRLASEERLAGVFDYTFGVFYSDFSSPSDLTNRTLVGFPTGQYTLRNLAVADTLINRRSTLEEASVFANLTYHLGESTELSAGARYIDFTSKSKLIVAGQTLADLDEDEQPVIWNVAASHRFTDDFMAYVNVGTSWRYGPSVVGVFRPLTPRLDQFLNLDSEDSTSYELGFKADLMDQRLRVNASVFHQDFKDFIYRGPSVWYVNLGRAGAVPAQFNFVANVDAKVDGAEVDVAFQATENFNLGLTLAYAKGEMEDGVVACNDFNSDGVPDTFPTAPSVNQIRSAAGEEVGACTVNDRLSFAPDWTGTLQAEYKYPVTPSMDLFGRGLYSYYKSNEQDPNNVYDDVDAYGLLNVYAGIRSSDGAWEVSLFARNLTSTDEVLRRGNGPEATPYTTPPPTTLGTSLAGPYQLATYTPPREIGINLRYAFGSR
ncbi:TonB-dependent receptor [Steroidobacter agaridevorans]|uniref:TonB-dependent receptor n=1 Tax=Steroidobacter agaridevorans TaxID=2695856 RepID=A0A829Y9R5_9GAMM|nr:TonB-dependent receptor [Steroidobacter agaridevorans]GFE79785.1 TonB-dependent receptor [Steroidobacter agaridevorans]GFE90671.1 TonB-dependent receptor [Steroidobacter agaridevorans]